MKARFIALFVSLLLPVSLVHTTDEDTPVDIPDWRLHIMITAHLKKTRDATITVGDMETLSRFYAPHEGIKDITGLEFATNLYDLNLAGNRITDFTPLAGLPYLTHLVISGNARRTADLWSGWWT